MTAIADIYSGLDRSPTIAETIYLATEEAANSTRAACVEAALALAAEIEPYDDVPQVAHVHRATIEAAVGVQARMVPIDLAACRTEARESLVALGLIAVMAAAASGSYACGFQTGLALCLLFVSGFFALLWAVYGLPFVLFARMTMSRIEAGAYLAEKLPELARQTTGYCWALGRRSLVIAKRLEDGSVVSRAIFYDAIGMVRTAVEHDGPRLVVSGREGNVIARFRNPAGDFFETPDQLAELLRARLPERRAFA